MRNRNGETLGRKTKTFEMGRFEEITNGNKVKEKKRKKTIQNEKQL